MKTPIDLDTVDLTPDVEAARNALETRVRNLQGRLLLWDIMRAALELSKDFADNFESLSWQTRLAFTKAVVVEYAKPWTGNENPGLTNAGASKHLNPVTKTALHDALLELRNVAIAHADDEFHGLGVTLKGITLTNDRPNLHPRTLKRVFVPAGTMIQSSQSIWWFSQLAIVEQIRDHIQTASSAARDSIAAASAELVLSASEHIHVLDQLSGLLTLQELPLTSSSTADFRRSGHPTPQPGSVSTPEPLKIGTHNISGLATVFEPGPEIRAATLSGDGFKIRISDSVETGNAQFFVDFPSRKPILPDDPDK